MSLLIYGKICYWLKAKRRSEVQHYRRHQYIYDKLKATSGSCPKVGYYAVSTAEKLRIRTEPLARFLAETKIKKPTDSNAHEIQDHNLGV